MSASNESNLGVRSRALHAHLIAGSRTAASDLVTLLAQPLDDYLRHHVVSLDADTRHDVVYTALSMYVAAPTRCDTTLASPWTWLCGVVKHDGLDERRKRSRRAKIDATVTNLVEEWHHHANNQNDHADAMAITTYEEEHGVTLVETPEERAVLQLMMNGERDTRVFAETLGLDADRDDVAALVKRIKDKIKSRARRHAR
jgi:DNA-directed RNA polymerase specialized sigma24 family protein